MSEFKVRALEGIDGSGKTDSGKIIAAETGGRYFYFADGNPLTPLRPHFDKMPTLPRFYFYILMPLINHHRIEEMRQKSDVFVDRTIFSTIAYHKAYGMKDKWLKTIPPALIKQYDAMIYFSVSEDERKRRLGNRHQSQGVMTTSDQRSLDLGAVLDAEYRKLFNRDTIEVATDNKTQQQVAREVIERLYGRKN